jgi:hypothetical protein
VTSSVIRSLALCSFVMTASSRPLARPKPGY